MDYETVSSLIGKYENQAYDYKEERDKLRISLSDDGDTGIDFEMGSQREAECDVLYNKCLEIVQDLRKVI